MGFHEAVAESVREINKEIARRSKILVVLRAHEVRARLLVFANTVPPGHAENRIIPALLRIHDSLSDLVFDLERLDASDKLLSKFSEPWCAASPNFKKLDAEVEALYEIYGRPPYSCVVTNSRYQEIWVVMGDGATQPRTKVISGMFRGNVPRWVSYFFNDVVHVGDLDLLSEDAAVIKHREEVTERLWRRERPIEDATNDTRNKMEDIAQHVKELERQLPKLSAYATKNAAPSKEGYNVDWVHRWALIICSKSGRADNEYREAKDVGALYDRLSSVFERLHELWASRESDLVTLTTMHHFVSDEFLTKALEHHEHMAEVLYCGAQWQVDKPAYYAFFRAWLAADRCV